VNAEALDRIGGWARRNDATVIHFSTDYVFPGTGDSPWRESDAKAPLNWYGTTKLEGERRLEESGCHAVTFRTSWVFSEYGNNFVKTMLRLGKSRERLDVVSDQVGNPTYAMDIARFIETSIDRIGNREISGTYHLCNSGPTTWHGLAEYLFERAAALGHPLKIKSVAPIPSSQYPTPAKRPSNSVLCTERTIAAFGAPLPHWKDAVDRCLSKMGNSIEDH
jgi:dTDP-4-dehydrorhamnose reductase